MHWLYENKETNYCFILVNFVLFGFLSINRVNISNENTVANGKV
jgi:hypothetical protein